MLKALFLLIGLLLPQAANAAGITSINVTLATQEGGTALGGILAVTAPPYPIDISSGAGWVINPAIPFFSIHSHIYDAPNTPTNAVITFGFSEPTVVDSLLVNQHANGITKIAGFVGNSLASLNPIGDIFGLNGDVVGANYFTERSNYLFDFNNTSAGLYYQFVITKTSLENGYAAYSLNPLDSNGIAFTAAATPAPEPSVYLLATIGIFGLGLYRNRIQSGGVIVKI